MKLELNTDPYLTSYNYFAFIGGILFANDEDALPYYLSKHILPYCGNGYNFNFADDIFYFDDNVFDYYIITTNELSKSDIENIIIENLNKSYYASVQVNEFYIPNRSAYQKFDFNHDMLIYGCDLLSRKFNTYGYDSTGYLSCVELDIELIINAICNNNNAQIILKFVKKHIKEPSFCLDDVKTSLQNFIDSKPNPWMVDGWVYGCATYDEVVRLLTESQQNHTVLNAATFHCIYEHKRLMVTRLKYMLHNNIYFPFDILDGYIELEEKAKRIENLLLKFKLTGKSEIIGHMIEGLNNIKNTEKIVLNKLFDSLTHKA